MTKLQIDDGAEWLLGYARAKLALLNSIRAKGSSKSMMQWFALDSGEQIHINSTAVGDTIRIIGGHQYLVNVLMPDPTPYRSLFLNTSATPALSINIQQSQDSAPLPNTTYVITAVSNGTIYGTINGSIQQSGSDNNNRTIVYTNAPQGSSDFSGSVTNGTQVIVSGSIISDTRVNTPYTTAFAGAISSYSAASGANLQAAMSDGTVLATVPQTTTNGSTFTPQWSGAWLGEEGSLTTTGNVPFVVPPDTQSSLSGATAVAREKARLKTNSTNAINFLKVGTLPKMPYVSALQNFSWDDAAVINHPVSSLPRLLSPFTVVVAQDSSSTVGNVTTITRVYISSYVDASGITQTETTTGTRIDTSITTAGGSTYHEYVYANYPVFRTDAVIGGYRETAEQRFTFSGPHIDGNSFDGGAILNGTAVLGNQLNNSTYGAPTNPNSFVDVPNRSSSLIISTLPLWLQYLRDMNPVDVNTLADPKPAYSRNWLSASMVPGEIISLVPFSPVKDGEDLGMFGTKTGATQVAIYGVARFKYNIDGSFSFVGWTDRASVFDLKDESGAAIAWPATNCVVKYTKFGWSDVIATVKAQEVKLKNAAGPTTNAEKFLRLIKVQSGI